jgi:hypothetical protein
MPARLGICGENEDERTMRGGAQNQQTQILHVKSIYHSTGAQPSSRRVHEQQ